MVIERLTEREVRIRALEQRADPSDLDHETRLGGLERSGAGGVLGVTGSFTVGLLGGAGS